MKVYDGCKIYGPYKRKDGRKHVCIMWPDGKKQTVSYPKYIMECYINRYLEKDETVDHIDRNFNNNDLDNLQILIRQEHIKLDAKRVKNIIANCEYCGKQFERKPTSSLNKRKTGYFCSRQCVGKYGRDIQLNKIKKKQNKVKNIKTEYYYLEK